jgi:glycine cleavage system H lipoate-binding protein
MRNRPAFFADDIMLWEGLSYSPNHFWVDRTNEGWYRIGIDGFAAHLLGRADRVEFVTGKGNPTARITAGRAEFNLEFPEPLSQLRLNRDVTVHPDWLTKYLFTTGWLFEGKSESNLSGNSPRFFTDTRAGTWTKAELRRLTSFVHSLSGRGHPELGTVMMDGGSPAPGLLRLMSPNDAMLVVRDFFAPDRTAVERQDDFEGEML